MRRGLREPGVAPGQEDAVGASYKPEGYPSISPYLIVADAQTVIDFLVGAFAGVPLGRHERDDGSIMHAEVRIEDSVVMIGQAMGDWPPVPCHVHLYVPDVDATFARALDHGAEPVQPPTKGDDPDRRGGVRGPGGNTWWVSTQLG